MKKTIIIMPFDNLASKIIIGKLKEKFPSLLENNRIYFTRYIDQELSDIFEGDNVVLEDDSEYTISSISEICLRTQRPVIVLKDNEFLEIFVSRKS